MYANKSWASVIFRALLLSIYLMSGPVWAVSDPCVGGKVSNATSKVTVLFVNGIFNTLADACSSSAKLIASMPIEAGSTNYSYIWNPDSWLDPLELIDQERISSDAVVSTRLRNGDIFDKKSYYQILGEKYQLLTQSPTEKRTVVSFTRALHYEIENLLQNGQSVVVVPHSQGNHMIEAAYAMFVFHASLDPSKSWKLDKIRVVGAASVAHTTPSGKYVTIAEDGALASFEAAILFAGLPQGRPLERNYAICTSFFDFSCRESVKLADFPTGHGFAEIYLNGNLKDAVLKESMRTIFVKLTSAAINELDRETMGNLIPHTGITASQCYKAGSNNFVSCSSPEALALNDQQDGMRASKNPMSYREVGGYSRTDCILDVVTGLMWEGKPNTGLRAGSNLYTNYGDDRTGDISAYVKYVNTIGLCEHTDWRTPNADELYSTINLSINTSANESIAALDKDWFPGSVASYYHTASSYTDIRSARTITIVGVRGIGGREMWSEINPTYSQNVFGVRLVRSQQ